MYIKWLGYRWCLISSSSFFLPLHSSSRHRRLPRLPQTKYGSVLKSRARALEEAASVQTQAPLIVSCGKIYVITLGLSFLSFK